MAEQRTAHERERAHPHLLPLLVCYADHDPRLGFGHGRTGVIHVGSSLRRGTVSEDSVEALSYLEAIRRRYQGSRFRLLEPCLRASSSLLTSLSLSLSLSLSQCSLPTPHLSLSHRHILHFTLTPHDVTASNEVSQAAFSISCLTRPAYASSKPALCLAGPPYSRLQNLSAQTWEQPDMVTCRCQVMNVLGRCCSAI